MGEFVWAVKKMSVYGSKKNAAARSVPSTRFSTMRKRETLQIEYLDFAAVRAEEAARKADKRSKYRSFENEVALV